MINCPFSDITGNTGKVGGGVRMCVRGGMC